MKTVNYVLADPTANRTILVRTPVPSPERRAVADALMAAEPTAEQVGFVQATALTMTGGEFCGNASMAAAALHCREQGLPAGQTAAVTLTVSGVPHPVGVTVTAAADGWYTGRVAMPAPVTADCRTLPCFAADTALPVIAFPGITHVIAESPLERAEAETIIKPLCRHLGADALGLLLFDRAAGRLTPLVYVPAADTLCWENSCASGTAAVGAWLFQEQGKPQRLALTQPGGTLTAEADRQGLWLSGTVTFIRDGVCMIP